MSPFQASALIRCKTSILNRYKLTGLQFAVTSPMKVCPNVQDRCCSINDEITISKFWRDTTQPLLNTNSDKIIKSIWLTTQYFRNITNLDPQLIMIKHLIRRRIPFRRTFCNQRNLGVTRQQLRRIQGWYQVADRGPDYHVNDFDFRNQFSSRNSLDNSWNIQSAGHVNRTVSNRRFVTNFMSEDAQYNINTFPRTERELEDLSSEYNYMGDSNQFFPGSPDQDLSRFKAEGNPWETNDLDTQPQRLLLNATGEIPTHETPSNITDHFDMYAFRPGPTAARVPEQAPTAVTQALRPAMSTPEQQELPSGPRLGRPEAPVRDPSSHFDLYKSTFEIIDASPQPAVSPFRTISPTNRDPLSDNQAPFDLFNPDHRAERNRARNSTGGFEDDAAFRFQISQQRNNESNVRSRAQKNRFRIPDWRIEGSRLSINSIRCQNRRSSFIKDYIIINEEKVEFCFGLYRRFLNFDIEMFEGYLPKIKEIISHLGEHKRSFYCSICDAHQQAHYSQTDQLVYYSDSYCRDTLTQYRDYFMFMNIIYVDYVDSILQYIQCFESDGLVFEFPFQNFLVKMKQRFPFWKTCLDSLESEYFINSCWSICNKLSINSRSSLIEGNLDFFERATATIFSFLRKVKIEQALFNNTRDFETTYAVQNTLNLRTLGNVDGLLLEPLGPALLITENKYVIDKMSSPSFFNQNPQLNLTNHDQMQLAVDEMLSDLQLGSTRLMLDYGHRIVGFAKSGIDINEKFLHNDDRLVSSVNGLFNQLYKLRTIEQISPSGVPTRFLKQETFKIMKRYGLKPKEYMRSLRLTHQNSPEERKLQLHRPPFRNQAVVAKNFTFVHAYGRPLNISYKMIPLIDDPSMIQDEQELNIEIYAKILNGTDIKTFGVTYESEGLNPLLDFQTTKYDYNITKLIGLQFTKTEKIDSDVIKMFMACSAIDINLFNEQVFKPVDSLSTLEGKFIELKKATKMDTIIKILAPDTNVSLGLQMQFRFRDKVNKMMKTHHKNEGLEEMEDRMQEIYKLSQLAKDKERDSYQINDHWFPAFDDLFNGMADMFISLFGS